MKTIRVPSQDIDTALTILYMDDGVGDLRRGQKAPLHDFSPV
jgi:hypothetical protein